MLSPTMLSISSSPTACSRATQRGWLRTMGCVCHIPVYQIKQRWLDPLAAFKAIHLISWVELMIPNPSSTPFIQHCAVTNVATLSAPHCLARHGAAARRAQPTQPHAHLHEGLATSQGTLLGGGHHSQDTLLVALLRGGVPVLQDLQPSQPGPHASTCHQSS